MRVFATLPDELGQFVATESNRRCMSPQEYLRSLIREQYLAAGNKPQPSKVSAKRRAKVQAEPALEDYDLDDMLTADERLTIEEEGRRHREATIGQF